MAVGSVPLKNNSAATVQGPWNPTQCPPHFLHPNYSTSFSHMHTHKTKQNNFFNGDLIIFHLPKNAPGTVFLRHFTSGAPNVRLGTKCLKPQCQMLVIRECYWHSLIKQKKKHIRFEECYFSGYRQNSCSKTSVTGPSLWTLQYNSDAKIHVQVYERMKPL